MRVAKWGNSLAIRLPIAVVGALDLKAGDDVIITAGEPRALSVARTPDRDALMERLRAFSARLPADFVFDRDEANAR